MYSAGTLWPIHSMMHSLQEFLCLPLFHLPSTVPWRIISLQGLILNMSCPNQASSQCFIIDISGFGWPVCVVIFFPISALQEINYTAITQLNHAIIQTETKIYYKICTYTRPHLTPTYETCWGCLENRRLIVRKCKQKTTSPWCWQLAVT